MEIKRKLTAEQLDSLCKGRSLGYTAGITNGINYADNHPTVAVIYSILRNYFDDTEAPDINAAEGTKEREDQMTAAAEYLYNKLNKKP